MPSAGIMSAPKPTRSISGATLVIRLGMRPPIAPTALKRLAAAEPLRDWVAVEEADELDLLDELDDSAAKAMSRRQAAGRINFLITNCFILRRLRFFGLPLLGS